MKKKLQNILSGKGNLDLLELIKGSGAAFITNALGFMFLYALTVLITRNFGAKIYGDYALFTYTVRIITIFAVFGVDIMSLRYISEYVSKSDWGKVNQITGQSYFSLFILASSVSLICYFFSSAVASALKVPDLYAQLIGLGVFPYSFNKFHNQCFRGQKKIMLYSSFEFALIPLLSILVLGALLLTNSEPFEKMYVPIAVHIGSVILVSFVAYLIWNSDLRKNTIEKTNLKLKSLLHQFFPTLKQGLPFLLARTSTYLAAWSMLFLLKYFRTSEEVGIYEAALKVAQLTILPLSAINTIAAPKFSALYGKNDQKGLQKTARQATMMSILAALPVVLIIAIFAKQIMGFYGEEFSQGILILQILAVGQFINAFTGPVAQMLQMTENQNAHQNITLVSMLVSVLAGIFLVKHYGLLGTAITYLIFVVVNNGVCYAFVNWKLKIDTLPRFRS